MRAKIGDRVRSKETISMYLRKGEIYIVMNTQDKRLLSIQHPKEGPLDGLWHDERFELLPKFDIGDTIRCLDPAFPALSAGLGYKVIRLCDCKQVELAGVSGYWDASRFELVVPELPVNEGHPHAALMAEYAKDALTSKEPWTLWEYRKNCRSEWLSFTANPSWSYDCIYRRRSNTVIKVNGFDVPAPLKDLLEAGIPYYVADPSSTIWYTKLRTGTVALRTLLNRGLVHDSQEAAVAHAKALLGINPKDEK